MSQSRNRLLVFGSRGFLGSSLSGMLGPDTYTGINRVEDLSDEILDSVDVLINCAGASNVLTSFQDPVKDYRNNTTLVQQLLEKIRLSGNKNIRLINLSSAAVYGNPQKLPIKESEKLNPISPYGYHKMMAEDICRMYYFCYGIKTLSLRIFSAYGPGQQKMLLWDLHQKIKNSNGKITLFGTGEESRDFIHINDIFQQLILAINYSEFQGETINVANGKEVKIREIVELYKKHHPIRFNFTFNGQNRPGDPLNWLADISKMKEWGFQSKVTIEEGISDYIKWVKSNS
jgi:dTDP-glucose 4,6-dehydratase/UDP-glucose 4-epimerase